MHVSQTYMRIIMYPYFSSLDSWTHCLGKQSLKLCFDFCTSQPATHTDSHSITHRRKHDKTLIRRFLMFLVICKLNKLIGTWDEDSLPGMQEQGKTNTPRNTACKSSECINQKNRLSSRQAPPVAIDAFLFCYLGGVWKATVNTIPKHSTNPTNTHKLWDFEELWAVFCVSAVLPTLTPAVCFKHKTPKCLYFSRTISCFQHCEQVFNCIIEKKAAVGVWSGDGWQTEIPTSFSFMTRTEDCSKPGKNSTM